MGLATASRNGQKVRKPEPESDHQRSRGNVFRRRWTRRDLAIRTHHNAAMRVDVSTQTVIARPIEDVWAYATDPSNAPEWYSNIAVAEPLTNGSIGVGSKARFSARFLGRTLNYTYAVLAYEPMKTFTMATAEGPFPMTTTYEFEVIDPNRTRMTLRNHGEPTGFGAIAAPIMTAAMRRANRADLSRIRAILQGQG